MFYYLFFSWQKKELNKNEFTYHKKSGIKSVLMVLIFVAFAETFVMHLFLMEFNKTVAWVLFGVSIYTGLQIISFTRSISKRPVVIDFLKKRLFLRYGFFSETTIPIEQIEKIEFNKRSLPDDKSIVKLSPLGMLDSHNIILHLNQENTLSGIYGISKKYNKIAINIDEKEKFQKVLNSMLKK